MKVTYEFTEPTESHERAIFENSYRYSSALAQLDALLFDLRKDLLSLPDKIGGSPEFLAEQLEASYDEARDFVIDFVCAAADLIEKANVLEEE